jgi:hypothetical protein
MPLEIFKWCNTIAVKLGLAHSASYHPVALMKIHTITLDDGRGLNGTAGTDLTGWSIIPYNERWVLILQLGIIRNNAKSIKWFVEAISGLQNGAPDGLALVNNLGSVFNF